MSECRHQQPNLNGRNWADEAGIWFSFLCLIHCAFTPILLALMPALVWGGDRTHLLMAFVLPFVALIAFIPAYRKHGDWKVIVTALVGLSLIVTALWARATFMEVLLTMCGSLILISAHWRNRRLKGSRQKAASKSKLDKYQKTQAYGGSL